MGQAHPQGNHAKTSQLPAQPDQGRYKKLDLVPILVSANTDVLKTYDDIFAVSIPDGYSFIND